MSAVNLWKDCPGYAALARRERELRDVPWLGLPERVCGVDCAPLTLRRVQWLQMSKSPFLLKLTAAELLSKPGIANDVIAFLWIVSPEFNAGDERARKKCYQRIGKAVLAFKAEAAISECLEYIAEAFMDSDDDGAQGKSFYGTTAGLTVFYHKHFGLELDAWENSRWRNLVRRLTGRPNVIDIPLKVSFQLMRAHRNSQNPTVFTNRLSDAAVDRWLESLNQPAPAN